jgi:hypothetical protein
MALGLRFPHGCSSVTDQLALRLMGSVRQGSLEEDALRLMGSLPALQPLEITALLGVY